MTDTYRLSHDSDVTCEVLVIGSGAGGAVVAETLVGAGRDVVMIEEGAYIDPTHRHKRFSDELGDQWRNGGLSVAFGRVPMAFAEGKCVGGGTEINSGIMQVPNDETLDEWAKEYQIEAFSAQSMAPYFGRAFEAVSSTVDEQASDHASIILKRGAAALNWKIKKLSRAVESGNGAPHAGDPLKQSMAATCISKALAMGMRLISKCRADRIETKGNTVQSVRATATKDDGRTIQVSIRFKAVFVCAGAIQTPSILRRSGFHRNIGNRLQFHPMAKALAFSDTETAHDRDTVATLAVTEFMPDQRFGGSISTPPMIAMALAEDWRARRDLFALRRNASLFYAQIRASGLGTVRNLPCINEPFVRYSLTKNDLASLTTGLARLGRLLLAAGATRVVPGIAGANEWTSEKDCLDFEGRGCGRQDWRLSSVHVFGTAPAGENARVTATNSFGKIHGADNIYIADASQIPNGPSVNPQATVMAIAYRNAEHFLETSS